MDAYDEAVKLMPERFRDAMRKRANEMPEELRLRRGRKPTLIKCGKEFEMQTDAATEEDILYVLQRATGASLYSAAETLRRGFFCKGALRIGVCGLVNGDGRGAGFSEYGSICIRIAHDYRGVCCAAVHKLMSNGLENTLILSPPGGGKTTALRDIVRTLSDSGIRVGVIDERAELSSAGFDLGRCSDVLSGTDKLSSALLLLRSMAPQIVAMDEITAPEDIRAAEEISGCGVGIIATAHASDEQDLLRRESYRRLSQSGIFKRAVVIRQSGSRRTYEVRSLV